MTSMGAHTTVRESSNYSPFQCKGIALAVCLSVTAVPDRSNLRRKGHSASWFLRVLVHHAGKEEYSCSPQSVAEAFNITADQEAETDTENRAGHLQRSIPSNLLPLPVRPYLVNNQSGDQELKHGLPETSPPAGNQV